MPALVDDPRHSFLKMEDIIPFCWTTNTPMAYDLGIKPKVDPLACVPYCTLQIPEIRSPTWHLSTSRQLPTAFTHSATYLCAWHTLPSISMLLVAHWCTGCESDNADSYCCQYRICLTPFSNELVMQKMTALHDSERMDLRTVAFSKAIPFGNVHNIILR